MPKTYAPAASFNDPAERLNIPLIPVESGQVKAIGYDATTKTLAVTFTRGPGTEYQYLNVEPETHAAFISAESIGTYFGKHIKPLHFKKFEPAPIAA
jgi:hypothetical protein